MSWCPCFSCSVEPVVWAEPDVRRTRETRRLSWFGVGMDFGNKKLNVTQKIAQSTFRCIAGVWIQVWVWVKLKKTPLQGLGFPRASQVSLLYHKEALCWANTSLSIFHQKFFHCIYNILTFEFVLFLHCETFIILKCVWVFVTYQWTRVWTWFRSRCASLRAANEKLKDSVILVLWQHRLHQPERVPLFQK